MNFLAHIYLSENHPEITIGNFIADSLPNNKFDYFPKNIQKGILLHREIDSFTDTHPIVRESKKRLFETYRHFSPVIVDILYDHFLAKNWLQYSNTPLPIYVENFYNLLEDNFNILPKQTQRMIPYMIKDNWLLSYATKSGIGDILHKMNIRTKKISKMNFAILDLEKYYTEFEDEFTHFFDELRTFSHQKLNTLNQDKKYE